MTKPKDKGRWLVRLRCVVIKKVTCEDCTEQQAKEYTWEFAVNETELEQVDSEVQSVRRDR